MGVEDENEEASEAERREAEALARALEEGVAPSDLPADAWQAALLLKHAQAPDAPPPDLRVMAALERRRTKRKRTWSWVTGGGVALAATVAIAIGVGGGPRREAPAASEAAKSPPAAAEPIRDSDEALLRRFAADPKSVACVDVCAAADRLCTPHPKAASCTSARAQAAPCSCPTPR